MTKRLRIAANRLADPLPRLSRRLWGRLPPRVRGHRLVRAYGNKVHASVRRKANREMYLGTSFLRNRPALELMRRLTRPARADSSLAIAVLGCSIGVEAYSIQWALRHDRRDAEIALHAMDISHDVVSFAERGIYGPDASELVHSPIFDGLTQSEKQQLFDWNGDQARVKPWLRQGITWHVGDACDPELIALLGEQDVVVANNFLCHMDPTTAERCLRNLAKLVTPGGHLFVSGVDLDVRTRVALDLKWAPVSELREEIHEGDAAVRADWPWEWWGLEPIDRRRTDWAIRYASVFRIDGEG